MTARGDQVFIGWDVDVWGSAPVPKTTHDEVQT